MQDSPVKHWCEFEFISKAESAHLAMALDATYFPFRAENDNKIYTDEAETSMMEGMMKVYWYAPEQVKRMQSIWNTNYTERNMLEFFDTKENIDIKFIKRIKSNVLRFFYFCKA